MKKDKTYKLEKETIEELEKIKKELDVKYDKLFKILLNAYYAKEYGDNRKIQK